MTTPLTLDLNDLRPAEATLKLAAFPDKVFTFKKFTLNDRIWAHQRFGAERMQKIFTDQSLPEIGEIAYRLLKEKTQFPKMEDFFESIETMQDQSNLLMALLTCVGVSEKLFQKLAREFESNDKETESGNGESPTLNQ